MSAPSGSHDHLHVQGIDLFPSYEVLAAPGGDDAFWRSEPTGIWQPKVADALGALADGATRLQISARNGTGKSLQFARLLRESVVDISYYTDIDEQAADARPLAKTIILDEVGHVDTNTDFMVSTLLGRRGVLITTGSTADTRRSQVGQWKKVFSATSEYAHIVDLGDISRASVEADKAAYVVEARGGRADAVQLVRDYESLRNLRLFDALFLRGLRLNDTERFGAADVIRSIREFGLRQRSFATFMIGYAFLSNKILNEIETPNPSGFFAIGSVPLHDAEELHAFSGLASLEEIDFNDADQLLVEAEQSEQ